jgi:hypothetical protein
MCKQYQWGCLPTSQVQANKVLHSPYMSNRFQTESYYHIRRCLFVNPVCNRTHGSMLTGGHCAVVEVVLQLSPGDVSSLRFNVVLIHVPSGWLSVVDNKAFWCSVGWGRLGHYQLGRLPVVATNHLWSQTLIRNHRQRALAVLSIRFHHMGHANMTSDMFQANPCSNNGGFLANH